MIPRRKPRLSKGIFRKTPRQDQRLVDRLHTWLEEEKGSLKLSFNRLRRTVLASSLTILVLAITLALPASFHAIIQNAKQPIAALEITSQISLFLKPELSNEAGRKVTERIRKSPRVAAAELITKEAGLAELSEFSGFTEALSALSTNPLPAVVIVRPRETDPVSLAKLLDELKNQSEADLVQFDTEWLEKLQAMLAIAERCALAFSTLLGFGVLFIVGNTIRLELQNRREEIAVTKLLGASNSFIRRPFLHTGMWYGFLGATVAWILANLLILGIRGPAIELARLYGSDYRPSFLGITDTLALIAAAIAIGAFGAWIVVTHYLRKFDPPKGTTY